MKANITEDLKLLAASEAKKRKEETRRIEQEEQRRRQIEAMIASRGAGWKRASDCSMLDG